MVRAADVPPLAGCAATDFTRQWVQVARGSRQDTPVQPMPQVVLQIALSDMIPAVGYAATLKS